MDTGGLTPSGTNTVALDATAEDAPGPAARPARTIGRNHYPVILPNVRDPRLHVAAVIITIHVLGQVGLRFSVSVPQILSAILTCAVIEVTITFWRRRSFVWPASAMLTGSGVALILRVPGMQPSDHWSFQKWYLYSAIAGASLLTKYVIRRHGAPMFNPSNVGLVVAFILLGSTRIEPLDFWWAPLDRWMIPAYAVIVVGGLLITWRLHLLAVAASFWLTLAAGIGLLAASGHCITARWAFAPLCGVVFWRVIMTSPEVLIFLFFMITDPKTVPAGRVGRVVFGVLVAVASTLFIAPQTNEFGTKVALLGGLVFMCALRPLLDRVLPAPGSEDDDLRRFARRLVAGSDGEASAWRGVFRLGLTALVAVAIGAGVVAGGSPARGIVVPAVEDVLGRVPTDVDPATFPTITVEQGVLDWNHEIAGPGAQAIVLTLAENLELENRALLRRDASLLEAVDHGDRLDEMRARLRDAQASGTTVLQRYQIDHVNVTLLVPFGKQVSLSLGLNSTGTVTTETYDAAGRLQAKQSAPFATMFVVRQVTGARWLDVAVLPPSAGN